MNATAARRSTRREHLHEKVFLCRQAALILAGIAAVSFRNNLTVFPPIVVALAVAGLLNTALYWLNSIGRFSATLEFAQIALDVGAISVMVWSSGGVDSPFFLLYLVEILAAAVSLSRGGALTAIALAVVGYLSAISTRGGLASSPLLWLHAASLPAVDGWPCAISRLGRPSIPRRRGRTRDQERRARGRRSHQAGWRALRANHGASGRCRTRTPRAGGLSASLRGLAGLKAAHDH